MMSKPQPTLSQMPLLIKERIFNLIDTKTKYRLRPVSNEFKSLVESFRISYKSLKLIIDTDKKMSTMKFETDKGEVFELNFYDQIRGRTIFGPNGRYLVQKWCRSFFEVLISQVENFLKSSRTYFRKLTVAVQCTRTEHWNEEYDAIRKLVYPRLLALFFNFRGLKVEHFHMHFIGSQDEILVILPYLEAGTLKKISFSSPPFPRDSASYICLDRVAETEQWKKARKFSMTQFKMSLAFEKWAHFAHTEVKLLTISPATLQSLLRVFFKAQKWKSSVVHYDAGILQQLDKFFTLLKFKREAQPDGRLRFSYGTIVSVTITETTMNFTKSN